MIHHFIHGLHPIASHLILSCSSLYDANDKCPDRPRRLPAAAVAAVIPAVSSHTAHPRVVLGSTAVVKLDHVQPAEVGVGSVPLLLEWISVCGDGGDGAGSQLSYRWR